MEGPPNTDGPVRNFYAGGEPMQAYREVAQAVIASAVTDLVKGRTRAEEAYQFLCGAGDDNRAVLKFWCFVAGYTPDQVMSTARARSVCAWPTWWLTDGKHRLKQIQHNTANRYSTSLNGADLRGGDLRDVIGLTQAQLEEGHCQVEGAGGKVGE